MAQNTKNVRPVRPVRAVAPAKKKSGAVKKVGIAAVVVATLVSIALGIKALTTSKNAKKNKKRISKTYSRFIKKAKRFVK